MLTGMGIPIEDRITGSGSKGTITMGNGKTDPEPDLTPETGKEQHLRWNLSALGYISHSSCTVQGITSTPAWPKAALHGGNMLFQILRQSVT